MGLAYDATRGLGVRFIEHVRFGLSQDIDRHGVGRNWAEKLGDLGLWMIEKFPGKAITWIKEPRLWMPTALSSIALAGVTYTFYPAYTTELLKDLASRVSIPTVEQLKCVAYFAIVFHIVAASLRVCGRLCNTELMEAWYNNKAAAV